MKQGDKIRVKTGNKFEGRTGTVTSIGQSGKTVEVEFNDEATAWHSFVEQELEAIGYRQDALGRDADTGG
jgi:ribosomal protein L21E